MSKKFYLISAIMIFMMLAATTLSLGADWILSSNSGKLPADLETLVLNAGGTLVSSVDEVGIATVSFPTREDAEAMEAYGFEVMPDITLNWVKKDYMPTIAEPEHIGLNEPFFGFQWHLPVIEADRAWDEGVTGMGVRVAVVDSGVWYLHPDLMNNIDYASSATYVPGTTDFLDDDGHGTHVAGIIAAADNDWGCIGVAPDASIIGVKVLAANGSGNISWIVAGIIHAVNVDADIINLSLGSYIQKNGVEGLYTAREAQIIINLYRRVLNWAHSQGSLVFCSAGNDALDLNQSQNIVKLPAEVSNGVTVAATGPYLQQNFDNPASYSNYGTSAITVAAPGGDFQAIPHPDWFYDMVLSTTIEGWSFIAGTSQATPVAAGVAALILSKYGPMPPSALKNHLCATTDDLGKPGKDDHYGKGRVNAYKAVTR